MKAKLFLITFFCLFISVSCKKGIENPATELHPEKKAIAEKEDVTAFEIVTLKSKTTLLDQYSGKFSELPVTIYKTSDSTLGFTVPNMATGDHLLKFDLGYLTFKVTGAKQINVEKLSQNAVDAIYAQLPLITSDPMLSNRAKDELKLNALKLIEDFSKLTLLEKTEILQFSEANRALLDPFLKGVDFLEGVGGLTLRSSEQNCSSYEWKQRFICHADNLAELASKLNEMFFKIRAVTLSTSKIKVSPLLWWYGELGSILRFRRYLNTFKMKCWILNEDMFSGVPDKFSDQVYKNLNLKATYRNVDEHADKYYLPELAEFHSEVGTLGANLSEYDFLGQLENLPNLEEPVEINSENITISDISNSKVELIGKQEQNVKFRALGQTNETFEYKLTIRKNGFEASKKLSAEVMLQPSYKIKFVDAPPRVYLSGQAGQNIDITSRIVNNGGFASAIDLLDFRIMAKSSLGEAYEVKWKNLCHPNDVPCYGGLINFPYSALKSTITVTHDLYWKGVLVDSKEVGIEIRQFDPYGENP